MGSWRTSATTTRTSRPSRARPRTSSSRSLRTDSSRPRSCPARMPTCSRSARRAGSLTWRLTGNQATATPDSPRCQGSITIVKVLNPSSDDGRFTLELDGKPAGGAVAVGDGGTTGTIAVDSGSHTVGESGAGDTDLSLYDIRINCLSSGVRRRRGQRRAPVGSGEAPAGGRLHDHEHAQGGEGRRCADAGVRGLPPRSPRRRGLGLFEPGGLSGHDPARERQRLFPRPGAPWPAERVPAGTADRRVPDAVRQHRARSPGRSAARPSQRRAHPAGARPPSN